MSGVMIGCVLSFFTGCSFAPNSKRPEMPIPQKYKEGMPWVMAKPSLAKESKHCRWWTVFHDPVLNNLESQLSHTNPSLNQAFERFQMSKALAQEARSFLLPTILGLGAGTRQGNSKEVANVFPDSDFLFDTFTLKTLLTYEVDVWGQVRNTAAAAEHTARATEFDMAAMDLSLHASLAEIYFQLRGENQEQIALDRIVAADEHALFLIHQLHIGGVVSAYEEDQMQKTVEQAKTAATKMRLSRAKLEHALAVLIGAIPANFHLEPTKAPMRFVAVSPDLPSELLQRRPDVAAAAQRVQAANATIGVARAAFFPVFTISSLVGIQAKSTAQLFSRPSLIWALGPPSAVNMIPAQINQVIFDGYYLQANLKQAKASYYDAVNKYRETVLMAYKDVEDGLVEARRVHQEIKSQAAATRASFRAVYQVNERMKNGMDTYLGVYRIEDQALNNRLALIELKIQGQMASIHLVKALGGGWDINQAMKNKI
ncbi:MAG: efflux transporter outer membrane subunit [Gammaproteobacteria bacterium]|nr:efflux transporter outer membrane subunit [Gammaproteobacteria bacterium]